MPERVNCVKLLGTINFTVLLKITRENENLIYEISKYREG